MQLMEASLLVQPSLLELPELLLKKKLQQVHLKKQIVKIMETLKNKTPISQTHQICQV
jgi:hypothetical protein